MYYNVYYDYSALVLILILLACRAKYFKSEDRTLRMFMNVLIMAFVAGTVDIVAAYCYSGRIPITDQWLCVVETVYLILAMLICLFQFRIICFRMDYDIDALHIVNFLGVAAMTIALLLNIGLNFMFHYENHVFVSNPSFHLVYLVTILLFLEMAFVLIVRGKRLRKKVLVLTSSVFFIPVICIIVQFMDDRLLLSGIGVIMAMFLFSFTLGEEEFEQLQETLGELEESEKVVAQIRDESEKARRVKRLFMERVTNEFETPLAEVVAVSEQLKECQVDANIEEYVEQIGVAGNQLRSFYNELINAAEEEQSE